MTPSAECGRPRGGCTRPVFGSIDIGGSPVGPLTPVMGRAATIVGRVDDARRWERTETVAQRAGGATDAAREQLAVATPPPAARGRSPGTIGRRRGRLPGPPRRVGARTSPPQDCE